MARTLNAPSAHFTPTVALGALASPQIPNPRLYSTVFGATNGSSQYGMGTLIVAVALSIGGAALSAGVGAYALTRFGKGRYGSYSFKEGAQIGAAGSAALSLISIPLALLLRK